MKRHERTRTAVRCYDAGTARDARLSHVEASRCDKMEVMVGRTREQRGHERTRTAVRCYDAGTARDARLSHVEVS